MHHDATNGGDCRPFVLLQVYLCFILHTRNLVLNTFKWHLRIYRL
jgi:hypothetical protein